MRITRSRFANVHKDGEQIHTQVRVVQSGDRVAVFASKSQTVLAVYDLHDITLETVSAPGCMCKEPSQQQLARAWSQYEAVNA